MQYTRYQADADTSGPRQAKQGVRKALAEQQRKHSQVTRPGQLANSGGFIAEASDRSAITVVAARDNIVVTLTFTSAGQLSMPDHAQLLDIETRALHAVKPA
ncbi:hypothetical protein ACFVRU_50980 [Streptomyces sp. NPDC057927]